MKVSDKDFDQLFESKLGNMEMEPSAMVWDNIADELDGKRDKKKGTLPYMRIAATIVVIMGAGLFFLRPDHEKVTLRGHSTTGVAVVKPAETTAPEDMVIDPASVAADLTTEPVKYISKQVIAKQQVVTAEVKPVDTVQNIAANTVKITLNPVNTQPVIAQTPVHNTDANTQVLKNTDIQVKPANILANKGSATKPVEEQVKRKRIHSLGDLLNVVIAKVDKRENKLIEFTNTTDDDSFNVTGLNLGIVRAKKEN